MIDTEKNGEAASAHQKGGGIKQVKEFVSTILWAVFFILVIRCFLFLPCNIPSGSMIPTLLVGDYIFVSKYSYGYSKYSFPFEFPNFKGRIWGALPQRGDIAVFDNTRKPYVYYVKRVIGLPGDTIQVKDSLLYINDQPVKRVSQGSYNYREYYNSPVVKANLYAEYLPRKDGTILKHDIIQNVSDGYDQSTLLSNGSINVNYTVPYVVPQGYFFAMGDNRDNSADSRYNDPDDPNYLGFIPLEHLIGKVQFVFYSYDRQHPVWQFWYWPSEIRWNRLFKTIQ